MSEDLIDLDGGQTRMKAAYGSDDGDEDLFAIAGHILLQPKVVNEKWGGGKIYY